MYVLWAAKILLYNCIVVLSSFIAMELYANTLVILVVYWWTYSVFKYFDNYLSLNWNNLDYWYNNYCAIVYVSSLSLSASI